MKLLNSSAGWILIDIEFIEGHIGQDATKVSRSNSCSGKKKNISQEMMLFMNLNEHLAK